MYSINQQVSTILGIGKILEIYQDKCRVFVEFPFSNKNSFIAHIPLTDIQYTISINNPLNFEETPLRKNKTFNNKVKSTTKSKYQYGRYISTY